MDLLKFIPNILSGARIVMSPIITYLAYNGKLGYALILIIILLFSDALDGCLARKFEAESELGEKYLDPLGDFSLTFFSILGLCLIGELDYDKAILIAIVFFTIKSLSSVSPIAVKNILKFISVSYYIIVVTSIILIYAKIALPNDFQVFTIVLISSMILFFIFKNKRVYQLLGLSRNKN